MIPRRPAVGEFFLLVVFNENQKYCIIMEEMKFISTGVAQLAQVDTITFVLADKSEAVIHLNHPGWDVTVECFKNLYDAEGRLDLLTAGKLLFDLNCVDYSENIEGNVQLMMTIASTLATKYLLPVDAQLKKNEED